MVRMPVPFPGRSSISRQSDRISKERHSMSRLFRILLLLVGAGALVAAARSASRRRSEQFQPFFAEAAPGPAPQPVVVEEPVVAPEPVVEVIPEPVVEP